MVFQEDAFLGRREQKKLETRRAIRDAALDLALEDGLESLTVELIAHNAGVSPRTFFNYFASKEDALVTEAAEGATQVRALLLERPAEESPMRALHHAIITSDYYGSIPPDRDRLLARQRLTQDHPSLMAHQLGKIANAERTFAVALAERMDTDIDQDLVPELLAATAVSIIRVAMRHWVAEGDRPLYELIDMAFKRFEDMDLFSDGAVGATS
ncbi:TetR/AcrR family transcriptional regulator [Yaniella halotolerans]|uniref:TetR/AcrR family transcriptional regulator n=1 Tax=Yaniella halotolerans TaxID=225453 RepID=UPI0004274BB9|nr:TetR family transcriptional regulator [Yaniella halotolerans]